MDKIISIRLKEEDYKYLVEVRNQLYSWGIPVTNTAVVKYAIKRLHETWFNKSTE